MEGLKYLIGYPILFALIVLMVPIAISIVLAIAATVITLAASIIYTPLILWKERKAKS